MRKIIILFISLFCLNANAINPLSGKFINNKGELSFTFIGDSLYIDCANSGCGISAFKLKPNKTIKKRKNVLYYDAFETYLEDDEDIYRQVLIKLVRKNKYKYKIEYYGKDKDRIYNTHESYYIHKVLN